MPPVPSSESCSAGRYPTEGAYPGYTFVDTGVPDALYTAISPLQGDSDLVTFFIGVEDMATSIADATRLGGKVVQEPVNVPGVQFALISDPLGHVVGLAQTALTNHSHSCAGIPPGDEPGA